MKTKLIRIDLSQYDLSKIQPQDPSPIEQQVDNLCVVQNQGGFKLVSTFVFGTDLMLVFQKQS
jgi:hypothetical protein